MKVTMVLTDGNIAILGICSVVCTGAVHCYCNLDTKESHVCT